MFLSWALLCCYHFTFQEKQRAAKNAKTVEKPADSEKTEKPKKAEKPTLAAKPDELTDTVEAEIKPEPVQEKTVSLTENGWWYIFCVK